MPKGHYIRTPKTLANIREGRKKMWARRSKKERSKIMSKIVVDHIAKLTPAERRERITRMNKARKDLQNKKTL